MTSEASQIRDPEARTYVDAPIVAALNRIAVVGIIGFVVVAGFASVPLIFEMDPIVHQAFHLLVPAVWLVLAALVLVWLIVHPIPHEHDVWAHAQHVDPSLTRYARLVSILMMLGWVVSFAVVILHHHLHSPRSTFITFGILVPLTLAAWILAVVAWNAWCRATLARAEHQAADRLRTYWTQLARSKPGH
jgi:hypothetical protein